MEAMDRKKNGKAEMEKIQCQFSVLQLQIVAAAICILAVLLLRTTAPSLYNRIQREFEVWFCADYGGEELVRFAQALVDDLFVEVEAAAAPEQCSLESYLPAQKIVAPLASYYLSSGYGWRVHPISGEKSFHNGVDLAADEGSAILCTMEGMVQHTGYDLLNGNYIILRHSDGVVTSCCHMQYVFVRAGEFVEAGQQIGTVGQTGSATGPHLHFVLKHNGIRYDPSEMLGL